MDTDTHQQVVLQSISTSDLHDAVTKHVYNPEVFVDTVIRESINLSASDLLFEPQVDAVRVRVRIDGTLYDVGRVAAHAFIPIAARLKVLGNVDSVERKQIQESQISLEHDGRIVNLRLEIVKTIFDELIVIRIHEKRTIVMELTELGLNQTAYQTYKDMIKASNGLILVCGPTGCGKTTTLYSTLNHINKQQSFNIMTVEDPVEFQLAGVNQLQVHEAQGFSFAEGLRTILRLSPDVIFVGEIRDKETAQTAIESGLTGHLVFSTVHSPDAVGTLFRMVDLGIETYLLNTALIGVLSQRLVRLNCEKCREQYDLNDEEKQLFQTVLGHVPEKLTRGKGCVDCHYLGFKGRTGIYEVLEMSATMRDMVRSGASEDIIRQSLAKSGFVSLFKDGLTKCEQGLTTFDQVTRNHIRPW